MNEGEKKFREKLEFLSLENTHFYQYKTFAIVYNIDIDIDIDRYRFHR